MVATAQKQTRKPNRSPHKILHVRADPQIGEAAHREAERRGMTLKQFIEHAITQTIEQVA